MVTKASTLSIVVPDGRDLAYLTHIGGMLDNKEFAHSVSANDRFSVSFLIRKGGTREDWIGIGRRNWPNVA
jgi:hypothetical protein